MSKHIADYVREVLGIDLNAWQRRILGPGYPKLAVPRQSPSRLLHDAWLEMQGQWMESVFPEFKVRRTVAEWHDRGLLTHNRDTPMFFDVQRMLDLDR